MLNSYGETPPDMRSGSLNGLSGRKTQPERLVPPPREVNRKMAATARGERKNEANAYK